jgi:hypothetical protein
MIALTIPLFASSTFFSSPLDVTYLTPLKISTATATSATKPIAQFKSLIANAIGSVS